LDVLGRDVYREIDPYISYDLIGLDQFFDALIRYRPLLLEDGLIGFGAMADAPFYYIFVDEHKIVTVRAEPELKPRIERVLASFDLAERDDPAGADSVAHEHRGVLLSPEQGSGALSMDEIVERLRDDWRLLLNVDPETNVDERGRDLGVTPWRCIVRVRTDSEHVRYAEVLITGSCMRDAEDLAVDAVMGELPGVSGGDVADADPVVVAAERMTGDSFVRELGSVGVTVRRGELGVSRIWHQVWLDEQPR
jgi:hypothetical protein